MNGRRLLKELQNLRENPPDHLELANDGEETMLTSWLVTLRGVEETAYAGQSFTLRLTFPPAYPIEAPEVRSNQKSLGRLLATGAYSSPRL